MRERDLVVDEGGDGERVEDAAGGPPDVAVPVLGHALVVEAVDLGDLPRLVVPPQQRHLATSSVSESSGQRDRSLTLEGALALRVSRRVRVSRE